MDTFTLWPISVLTSLYIDWVLKYLTSFLTYLTSFLTYLTSFEILEQLRTQPHILYDLPFTAPCCINIYEYNMLVMAQGSYHTTVRLAYFIVSTGSEPVPIRDYQVVWWGLWSLKRLTEFGVGCSLYCEREDKLALVSISNHCWLNCIVDSVKGGSLFLVRVYYTKKDLHRCMRQKLRRTKWFVYHSSINWIYD